MTLGRPFTFGVTVNDAGSSQEWRALARRVESLGFRSLFVPDHFGKQFAPFSALAVAATVTTTLRVGMLVGCNDFRHPALLAKEIATLDVLSDGRVDWGMGAGWFAPEYKATGLPFDHAPVRVDRLIEAVSVAKATFGEVPSTYAGTYYRVTDLDGYPKPVQRPHPPLLIGGAKRRMLEFAGREADIVGIAPIPKSAGSIQTRVEVESNVDRQLSWIRGAAGERWPQLECSMVVFPVIIDDDRDVRAERLGARLGMRPEAVLASPHIWLGTAEQICETIEERRRRWSVSSWTIPVGAIKAAAPIVDRLYGH